MENMNFIDLQDALRTQPDETLTSIKDKANRRFEAAEPNTQEYLDEFYVIALISREQKIRREKLKGAALLKSDADTKNALRGYFEAERRMGIRR